MQNSITRWLTGAMVIMVLVVSGCELNPTELSNDQTAIEAAILAELEYFTADLFSAQGAEDPDTPTTGPGRTLADIVPWRWGRQMQDIQREMDITINDDGDGPATADVVWTGLLSGTFHIIDTTATHYSKEFTDTAVRYATFERRENATAQAQNRGWRMTAISGTTVLSDPNSVTIQQVHLTSTGGLDTIITDVSTLINREEIIAFAPLDTITIEVTTGDPTDVILIHYPAWANQHGSRNHVRSRLRNNGDGSFTGQWVTRGQVWRNGQRMNPARHITIDVLSRDTIFTDDQPYDSNGWSFIYRVSG
ncbi:hypothetical protein ACFL6T_00565 [Candidatus Zixiibacteriota bacterium]